MHIFVSYSRSDKELVQPLVNKLKRDGFDIWWDANLTPNDPSYTQTIQEKIKDSIAVVVVWSPSSIQSRWVYAEAKLADDLNKLIQVKTDDLENGSVPLPFNSGHVVDIAAASEIVTASMRIGKRNIDIRMLSLTSVSDSQAKELAALGKV